MWRRHPDAASFDLAGNDESGNDESGNDESGNDESGNDESGHDESGHDQPGCDVACRVAGSRDNIHLRPIFGGEPERGRSRFEPTTSTFLR